jgi:hypothetical protein
VNQYSIAMSSLSDDEKSSNSNGTYGWVQHINCSIYPEGTQRVAGRKRAHSSATPPPSKRTRHDDPLDQILVESNEDEDEGELPDDPEPAEDDDTEGTLAHPVLFTLPIQLHLPQKTIKAGKRKRDAPKEVISYRKPPLVKLEVRKQMTLREWRSFISDAAQLDPKTIDWDNVCWRMSKAPVNTLREIGASASNMMDLMTAVDPMKKKGRGSRSEANEVTIQIAVIERQAEGEDLVNAGDAEGLANDTIAGRANPLRNATQGSVTFRQELEAIHSKGSCDIHPNIRCVKNLQGLHFELDSVKISSWAAYLVSCSMFLSTC